MQGRVPSPISRDAEPAEDCGRLSRAGGTLGRGHWPHQPCGPRTTEEYCGETGGDSAAQD